MKKAEGCICEACQECCRREPGWFMPEEVPAAAGHLGISELEFVTRYCAEHRIGDAVAISPATRPGSTTCIFFENGKCAIHDVKPHECRKVFACEAPRRHRRTRELIARKWK